MQSAGLTRSGGGDITAKSRKLISGDNPVGIFGMLILAGGIREKYETIFIKKNW